MGDVISKKIALRGGFSYTAEDLVEYITEEINKQCPAGYCFKQIIESLSDIKRTRDKIYNFKCEHVFVIYQKID